MNTELNKKVIPMSLIESRPPVITTLVLFLVIDNWMVSQGPIWLMYCLIAFMWVAYFILLFSQTTVKNISELDD